MAFKSTKRVDPEKEVLRAFLGEGTQFHGVLSFQGTVRLDGKFEGEIVSPDVLIAGESAEVRAEINVGTLIGRGKISGNVHARQRIEIHKGSVLLGDITTPALVIEEGAVYEGHCSMVAAPESKVEETKHLPPQFSADSTGTASEKESQQT